MNPKLHAARTALSPQEIQRGASRKCIMQVPGFVPARKALSPREIQRGVSRKCIMQGPGFVFALSTSHIGLPAFRSEFNNYQDLSRCIKVIIHNHTLWGTFGMPLYRHSLLRRVWGQVHWGTFGVSFHSGWQNATLKLQLQGGTFGEAFHRDRADFMHHSLA